MAPRAPSMTLVVPSPSRMSNARGARKFARMCDSDVTVILLQYFIRPGSGGRDNVSQAGPGPVLVR